MKKCDTRLIRLASALAAVILLITGCSASQTTTETTIPVAANQKLVNGRIVSILGNDVTLMVIQETAASTATGTETTVTGQASAPSEPDAAGNEAQPQPSGGTRTRPSGANGMRTRPTGSDSGGNWTRPSGSGGSEGEWIPGESQASGDLASQNTGTPSGETMTFMIPVGTEVITTLGKKTTFSRLAAGDTVKVLFETTDDGTSVVVGIWMSES